MSKSQALAAMGLGAFKVADGMLGEAEGAALSDTGFGALGGVPMILIYGAMAAEGGRQFGSGFDSFFGPDHKPATIVNDPADPSIAVNAARPSDNVGDPRSNVAAGPKNPADIDTNVEQGSATRRQAFRDAKRDLGIPETQQPDSVEDVPMRDRAGRVEKDAQGQVIKTREYNYTRADKSKVIIQEHSAGHEFGEGGVGDQGLILMSDRKMIPGQVRLTEPANTTDSPSDSR